jgi:hypothetical protein
MDNTQKDPQDWVSGDDPMTGAQASYLKTLAEQAHTNPPARDLTKAEASELIDELKQEAGLERENSMRVEPDDERRKFTTSGREGRSPRRTDDRS